MKKVIIAILSIKFLISCDVDTKNNKVQTEENITVADDKDFVISPVDSSKNILIRSKTFMGGVIMDKSIEGDSNSFTPSVPEIIKAEEIFLKCLNVDKIGTDSIEINVNELREPDSYIRQYFGRINEKGKKTIYMNCIYFQIIHVIFDENDNKKWQHGRIRFQDGGNNFFRVLINIDTKSCSGFSINGNA